ncbi:MAG TPA: hypothetical protein DDW30_02490 [Clostridiales bacterium]|nr:hypothetical protein [Clostridiales bacterium]
MEETRSMEETKNREIEIRFGDFVKVFCRCWWVLLLVGALVCGGVFGVLKLTHVPLYTATAKVYIIRTSGSMQAAQVSISNALVSDFIESVTMGNVLTQTREELGMNSLSNKELSSMVKVSNTEGSRLITLSVTARSAKDAVDLVDSLARNSVEYFNDNLVKEEYSQYVDKLDTEHPESCVVVSNPISKSKILLVGIAAVLLAYLVFFIIYVTDDKINTAEDLDQYLGINLLGQIPYRHTPREKTAAAKGDKA